MILLQLKGSWAVITSKCNADQINKSAFLKSSTLSFCRLNAVVCCASSPYNCCYTVNAALKAAEEKSLAERLRLGSLADDGLSYKEKFVVRSYEVGVNKTATVETIANYLQVSFLIY